MEENYQKLIKLERDVKKLKIGVWLSAITLMLSVFNTIARMLFPTFVVANPPSSNKPYWNIGPVNMITVQTVANQNHTSIDNVIELIHNNQIIPKPIKLEEHNVTWAIEPNYKIIK